MDYDELFGKKLRFRDIFKKSWAIYKENFIPLSLMALCALVPVLNVIAYLGVSIFVYNYVKGESVSVKNALSCGLKNLLKVLITGLLGLLIVSFTTIPFMILQTAGLALQNKVPFNIFTLIAAILLSAICLVPFFYMFISVFFFPYVCIIRNKWWFSGLRYSWKVVKGDIWRTIFFIMGLLTISYIAVLIMIAISAVLKFLAILTVPLSGIIVLLIWMYINIAFVTYFLNLESSKEIDLTPATAGK